MLGPCHFVCEEYVDDERFEYYEPLNKCLDPFEAECVHKGYEGAFMDYDYDPPACVCPSGYHFGEGADSKKCIVMDMNECSALSTVFPCTSLLRRCLVWLFSEKNSPKPINF